MRNDRKIGTGLGVLGALLFFGTGLPLFAQFDSGSDGSYGAIDVPASQTVTLQVPDDGIFHCTTISVGAAATLKFTKNAANTPVYLLATGDITVDGFIDVSGSDPSGSVGGEGGPGGFSGGNGIDVGQPNPGSGFGPGGGTEGDWGRGDHNSGTVPGIVGHGVFAGTAISRPKNGAVYGNGLLMPMIGGSGGGGTYQGPAGAGGGGGILLASNTLIECNGTLLSKGGIGSSNSLVGGGCGSGGAIRLVSPVVRGNGSIDVIGGFVTGGARSGAGAGRVRIDALVRNFSFSYSRDASVLLGKNMVVMPANLPVVEVIEAAGQAVDPAANLPVTVLIAPGQPSQQAVKVRVTNFSGTAQLKVVLTPEHGVRLSYDLDIDTTLGDPDEGTVTVDFPANQLTRVDVWTR